MTTITKFALALVLIAGIALIVFSGELLYIIYYRRKLRPASGPAESEEDSVQRFSLWNLLLKRSRVEPATSAAATEEVASTEAVTSSEEWELARWRSRVLYTIKEEEREDADSDVEKGFGFGPDKDEGAETPYYTPAASPERGEV